MKIRNKKLLCFFLVMFITLLCCCIVAANDNVANNTTTTQHKEVTVKTVQKDINKNNGETIKTTNTKTQSEDNTIEETDDQNEIEKENKTNAKAINKAKNTSTNTKTATSISGSYVLNGDITLSDGYSLTADFSLDGQGHTITYTGSGNLFTSNGYKVTLSNIVISNVPGYVIYGGYGHDLTACEFYDCNGIYKFDGGVGDTVLITTTNCYFSGTTARAFDAQVTGGTTGNIFVAYTSIFENYANPIFYCFNKGQFRGYNLIFGNTIATNAAYINNAEIQYQGSKPTVSIQKKAFDTNIVITAPDVHVNQTNDINVRLTATMDDGTIVGLPHENVTIQVTYANGSIQNLNGITNMNGQVYLTNMNGETTVPVTATATGIVRINVNFAGSRYTVDTSTGEKLYHAASKTQTYNVVGIPTTTTLSLNDSNVDKGDKVKLTANIINNDDTSVIVNEGSVTFYRGNTQIGTATVSNGVATLDYTTDTSGTLSIRAVYSNAANYNTSTSTVSSLTVRSSVNMQSSIVFVNESRVVVQTRLTNENGNPISGGYVNITYRVKGLVATDSTKTHYSIVDDLVTVRNTTNSQGYANLTIDTRYAGHSNSYSYVEAGHYDVNFEGNSLYESTTSEVVFDKFSDVRVSFPSSVNPNIVTDDNVNYIYYGNMGETFRFYALAQNTTSPYNYITSSTVRFWMEDGNVTKGEFFTATLNGSYHLFNPYAWHINGTNTKLNVTLLEDNLYYSSSTIYLEVKPKMNTTLHYEFVNTTYNDVTLRVKVANTSDAGQVVPGSVVIVKRDGNEIARGTTAADGFVNIKLPGIDVGSSPALELSYEGNVSHNGNTTNIPEGSVVIVNRDADVEVEDVITDYIKSTVTITANVTDATTGDDLTGSVTFKKDGTTIDTVTLVDGQASITYTIAANETVTITSVFNGDNYNEATGSTTVNGMLIPTVTSLGTISANVGKSVDITATVVNNTVLVSEGNVPQGSVTFKYGDQVLGTVNVNNGQAKLENVVFNHTDNSRITATYNDALNIYNASESSSTDGTLIVSQGSAHIALQSEYSGYYGDQVTITVNVTDVNSGKNIADGSIIFNDGSNHEIQLNGNGQASYTYTIGDSSKVVITATLSNANYTTVQNSTNVSRIINDTTVTISNVPDTASVSESFTFKVRLNTTGYQAVSGRTIIVRVNGEEITGLSQTNENGEISVTYTPKNNTSIVINATFEGDKNYTASNAIDSSLTSDKINLIPTKVTVSISPTTGTVYSPITITVGLTNNTNNADKTVNGTVTVHIGTHTETVQISTDTPTKQITYIPENNSTLTIYAEYAGKEGVYASNRTEDNEVKVNRIETNLIINVPSKVNISESFRFNITLTNATGSNDKISGMTDKINATVNNEKVTVYYDHNNQVYYAIYTPTNNTNDLVFNANFTGDNRYEAKQATAQTIDKENIGLIPTVMGIIVPETVKVGSEFTFKINLTNSSGEAIQGQSISVKINNQTYAGELTYADGLYQGKYTPNNNTDIVINASYAGTNVYNASEALNDTLTSAHINLTGTSLGVQYPSTVNVSQSVVLVINLTDDYNNQLDTSNITVKVDHNEITTGRTVSADGKTLTVTIPTSKDDRLTIDVEYPGLNGVYNATSKRFTVDVVKIPTTTTVTTINATAGNVKINVSVKGDDGVDVTDGNITVIANGYTYSPIALNGAKEITIPLTNLVTYGNFTINVQYSGNDTYALSNAEAISPIEVLPQNITFTVTANESVYVTEYVNITGVLKDGFNNPVKNRQIRVTVINETGTIFEENAITDENGVYYRLYPTTNIGTYNVTVFFGGMDGIESTSRQTNFTVNLIPTRTVVSVNNNLTGNFSISVNVTDNREGHTDTRVETGRIKVVINNDETNPVYHNITGAESIIPLDIQTNATTNILVTYEANEMFNTSSADAFDVNARVKETYMSLTASQSTPYNKTITINGTIMCECGRGVPNADVILVFNGSYTHEPVKTDDNGKFNFTIPASQIGNFEVNASFDGFYGICYPSNATATFNVTKIITDTEVLIGDESSSDLRVLFKVYNETTPVNYGTVKLYVGETLIDETDLSSSANLHDANGFVAKDFSEEYLRNKGITGGVTSVKAVYEENEYYLNSSDEYSGDALDNANIRVTVNQTSIFVDGSVNITVNVTDQEGNPIRGTLTLNISGNTTTVQITNDDHGIYSIIYSNTTADEYTVTARLDSAIYSTVTDSAKFNITKIPTTTNVTIHNDSWANASIDVIVYDARTNTSISEGTLNVVVNTNPLNPTTITTTPTNIMIPTNYAGQFALTVTYPETPKYLSSIGVEDGTGNEVVINIHKHDANLTVTTNKETYSVGENVTISGYLYDVDTGLPIGGRQVSVVVKNSTNLAVIASFTPTTTPEGYFEINRTSTVAGTFIVNATFEGTTEAGISNINSVNNSTEFTINKIPTTTTVHTLNSTYGNITISVNVKGNDGLNITEGTLTIKFGNLDEFTAQITGNETVITLPSPGIGDYNLNVSYPGNTKYVESNNTESSVTSITVQKQTATITVTANPTNLTVGDTVKISGYVYDGINNQTNLINGVVNITFVDSNGNPETVTVTLNNSYFEYNRQTKYAGPINVTVAYINDTFINSTAKTSYNVSKIPTNTTVSIYNDTYGNVELAVTIVDARNGNPITSGHYNLSINGAVQNDLVYGQDSNWINSTTFIVPVTTTSREINVTLNYTGDNTHESSTGRDENGVTPIVINSKNQTATLTINVNTTETYVGETINVNGTLIDGLSHVINGKINLTFTNGTYTDIKEVNVTNGRFSYNRTVNMTGTVNVTASYLGNDHINPVNATAQYTIDKLPTSVTITVVNNTVGNLTISVKVDETYHNLVLDEGNITIQYGNTIISDAKLNGTTTLFNITSTSQAPITIIVNFTGNLTHEFSTNNINTGLLERQVGNLTVSANNTVKVDQTLTINGTFLDGMGQAAQREITVYIYNSTGDLVKEISTSITNEDGTFTVPYVPTRNGTYTVNASYVGGDVIAPITSEPYTFTVEKVNTTTDVTVLNTTAGNVTIKVKVTDEYGNNITSGRLNVTVDGTSDIKEFTNVDEYTLKLEGILTNGTHSVTVEYPGTDDKYNPSKGNSTDTNQELTSIDVLVQQSTITIFKDAVKIYVGDNITIYGRLTDGMGNAIKNAVVNLTFANMTGENPVKVHNVTDEDGWYYYHRTTELDGTINVTVYYDGEENKINSSTNSITYDVEKIPTKVYINTLNNTLGNVTIETWVTSQLNSSENVTDGTLSVYINDNQEPYKTLNMSTLTPNENGRYTITLDTDYNDGENTVRVVYSGNYKYAGNEEHKTGRLNKDDVSINITLDKDSEFVNNNIKVNVSVTHNNNPVTSEINITILNSTGEIVKVISNNEYINNKVFTITNDTAGEYTIKVEYPGSVIYNALNATKTFTLNRLPTETLVDVISNVINNVTISVKVNDIQNNEIVKTGQLSITVDGNPQEPVNVNKTGVTIIRLPTTGSSVLVTVRYIENNQYDGSLGLNSTSREELTNITLSKQPTTITAIATPNETFIGTPITITGKLINPLGDVNNQNIYITINNTRYPVTTTADGSYTFTYDAQTSINNGNGTFTVTVDYDPNTNTVANASHNTTTIKVDKIPTNSSIEIINNTVGNITVNVKVVNATNGGSVTTGTVEFYDKDNNLIGSYPITEAENIIKLGNITTTGNIQVTAKYMENNMYLASDVKLDDDKTKSLENITVSNQTATILIDVQPTSVE